MQPGHEDERLKENDFRNEAHWSLARSKQGECGRNRSMRRPNLRDVLVFRHQ